MPQLEKPQNQAGKKVDKKAKIYSPCFGANPRAKYLNLDVNITENSDMKSDKPSSNLKKPLNIIDFASAGDSQKISVNFSNLSQFVKFTNTRKPSLPNLSLTGEIRAERNQSMNSILEASGVKEEQPNHQGLRHDNSIHEEDELTQISFVKQDFSKQVHKQ